MAAIRLMRGCVWVRVLLLGAGLQLQPVEQHGLVESFAVSFIVLFYLV
jgi:hypothetical protein